MTTQPPYPPPDSQPSGRDHPQATTALVLGILGLVLCGVLAPFAWVIGGRAVREIDASGGTLGGRGSANAGRILGIVGTVLLGISVVVLLGVLSLFIVGGVTQTTFDGSCTQLSPTGAEVPC